MEEEVIDKFYKWICKKYGHKKLFKFRKGIVSSSGFNEVARKVVQKSLVCKRCGKVYSEWELHEDIDYITSLTMPESHWNELRETGMKVSFSWFEEKKKTSKS